MKNVLTPAEAALALGVHVGTLRRWEREGKIHPIRTAGNQRRFRVEEVTALTLDSRRGLTRPDEQRSRSRGVGSPARQERAGISQDDALQLFLQQHGFVQDLEDEDPWDSEEDPPPQTSQSREIDAGHLDKAPVREQSNRSKAPIATPEIPPLETRNSERELSEIAALTQADAKRLEALKAYGRSLALAAPTRWQAKVTKELELYVNNVQFPPTLDERTAREFLSERVERVLNPWREENERERVRAGLVLIGERYAATQTSLWGYSSRREAREEVNAALAEEVDETWTVEEVTVFVDDFVDQILDEVEE